MSDAAAGSGAEGELSMVLDVGGEAAEPVPLVLRPLRSPDDYRDCVALERSTWGQDFSECVPASLLMVSQKVGGLAAGAFAADGRLVGMVYGLTGPRHGELVHWSHMLAVSADLRGRGLGRELKFYQRRVLREQGVRLMLWTYDPLVAPNAHLNINRLGARPVEYLRDLYGPDTSSELHSGLGTDRFVVEWGSETDVRPRAVESEMWLETPVVNVAADGSPLRLSDLPPDEERLRVQIPADIQSLKAQDDQAGERWRGSTRAAFERCMRDGFQVIGFQRDLDEDRCWYLLGRGRGA